MFGEKIFVDGKIFDGKIMVDEFMLIGEFIFVIKEFGVNVAVGIINKFGIIVM